MTHTDTEKFIHINHTIKNPNISDIDKVYNEYFTNHNKELVLCLVKFDFQHFF